MRISIVTIFPEVFPGFLDASLLGRALEDKLLSVDVHDLRDFTSDRHRVVDDEPYGGGGGMVMKAEPWIRAVRELSTDRQPHRILLSPQGRRLDEAVVRELAEHQDLLLMCGRYEGVDERVRSCVVDEEISIGDYVLSGGEVAAMAVIEALSRQIPGVVGLVSSVEQDSFRDGLLDYPHYTRPRQVEGLAVPDVLLSGDHAAIERWRRKASLRATLVKRPDLVRDRTWSEEDLGLLQELSNEPGAVGEAASKLAQKAKTSDNAGSRDPIQAALRDSRG